MIAHLIVFALTVYAIAGFSVALASVTVLGARLDDKFARLSGAPVLARLVVLWGIGGLWPLFVTKLVKGEKPRDA